MRWCTVCHLDSMTGWGQNELKHPDLQAWSTPTSNLMIWRIRRAAKSPESISYFTHLLLLGTSVPYDKLGPQESTNQRDKQTVLVRSCLPLNQMIFWEKTVNFRSQIPNVPDFRVYHILWKRNATSSFQKASLCPKTCRFELVHLTQRCTNRAENQHNYGALRSRWHRGTKRQ